MELKKKIIDLLLEKGQFKGSAMESRLKAPYWPLVHAVEELCSAGLVVTVKEKNKWSSEKFYLPALKDAKNSALLMRNDLDHDMLRLHYLLKSDDGSNQELLQAALMAHASYETALNNLIAKAKPQ